jgi:regulator of sigma D
VLKIAEEIYPDFVKATDSTIEFNDKYDLSDHKLTFDNFPQDLSRLGETLALRIEMEDKLLATMLD